MKTLANYILEARELFKIDDYAGCIDCCEVIFCSDPKCLEAYLIKMDVYISCNFYEEAFKQLKIIKILGLENETTQEYKINILINLEKNEEILELANKENNREIILDIASAFLNNEKYDLAVEWCNKAIKQGYRNSSIYLNKIKSLYFLGKYSEALKNIKIALKYKLPNPEIFYFAKGKILISMNEVEKGIALFKKTLSIEPNYYLASIELGCIYNTLNNKEEAIKYLLIAYKVDPIDEKVNFNLIMYYFNMEKYQVTIELCNKLLNLKVQANNAEIIYLAKGWSYIRMGKIEEAEEQYNLCSKCFKEFKDWKMLKLEILAAKGEEVEVEKLKSILDKDNNLQSKLEIERKNKYKKINQKTKSTNRW